MQLFDAHCHIGSFGKRQFHSYQIEPFTDRDIGSVDALSNFLEKSGIDKALVVPTYLPDRAVPFEQFNPLVYEAVESLDNVYGGLWVSPSPEIANHTREVLESFSGKKIVAFKMSPSAWNKGVSPNPSTWDSKTKELFEEIIDFAIHKKLVLCMHTGTKDSRMFEYEKFIEAYDVPIQLIHMGGQISGHFAFVPRFIKWIKEGRKVYCDTSLSRGFALEWLVRTLMEEYPEGLSRVFFASDNPWGLFEAEKAKIIETSIPEDIKKDIMYNNANAVYSRKL